MRIVSRIVALALMGFGLGCAYIFGTHRPFLFQDLCLTGAGIWGFCQGVIEMIHPTV